MKLHQRLLIAATGLLMASTVYAATIDVEGVKVEDSATVAGVKLTLNGAGVRYKGPFKVYVAELYTPKKVKSLGPDPDHASRGRAPNLFTAA